MSKQTENDTPDELASEYVLGTLSAQQREQVRKRMAHEPELRAAVDAWERRLLDLTDQADPETPSPILWRRVQRSINSSQQQSPTPLANSWWNLLPLWRGLAGAGIAATLVLAAVLMLRGAVLNETAYLVVLVAPQDKAPGWVVQASNQQDIQLIPLGVAEVPRDKALEFWTKGDDWQAPVSLGLVKPGQSLSVSLDKLPPMAPNQLFELTLESPTGSATGKPTGPIQFIGRAVKVI
ncbi:anti-sigma factor [Pseudomonas sp. EL_65y_Pfl2_R95]|uniref:anti-sigma factor n=1 Tax=Pseudomonas sp. EL_65y_Pfl2_R95 TaxID=3088698 RepID=UPI0030D9F93F